jgi:ankyrin repeat protein
MVSLLIDYDADIGSGYFDSLIYAAEKGVFDIVSLLLERGADPLERDELENSVLVATARGGPSTMERAKILKVLLEAGADPECMSVADDVCCALNYPISVLMKHL